MKIVVEYRTLHVFDTTQWYVQCGLCITSNAASVSFDTQSTLDIHLGGAKHMKRTDNATFNSDICSADVAVKQCRCRC